MKSVALLQITLLGALLFVGVRPQGLERPEVLIFNGLDEATTPFYMLTRKNEFDLTSYQSLGIENGRGHRFCYVGGVTLNTGIGYTGTGFFVPYSASFTCTVLLAGSRYRSFRFAGRLDDASRSTLSFYTEPQFVGQQTVVTVEQSNIVTRIASLYKTGSETWSLYLQPNFGGSVICVNSDAIVDVASLGVAPGDIKSARPGC